MTYFFAAGPALIALCLVFKDNSFFFYLSLVSSILIGVGSTLGESVNLGLLKTFPGLTIGYYGAGTGFAGLMGSLVFIILRPLGLDDKAIYLIFVTPVAIPYLISFMWLNRQKKVYPYVQNPEEEHYHLFPGNTAPAVTSIDPMDRGDQHKKLEKEGVDDNKRFDIANVIIIIRKKGSLIFYFALAVFLSITMTTSLTMANAAQVINGLDAADKERFVYKNAFVIF